jgi:RNA polymerase sigma-70 factor (ECF subfamily)
MLERLLCERNARLAHDLLYLVHGTHTNKDITVNHPKYDVRPRADKDLGRPGAAQTLAHNHVSARSGVSGAGEARCARFDALLAAHLPSLSRVAYRLCGHRETAEDLVQETLLRAWKHMDNIRDDKAAKGWLFMILRREAARGFRRQNPRAAEIEVDRLTDGKFDSATDMMALYEAIETLPEKYRSPLVMFAMGGYDVKEIAADLQLRTATVKTRLFRAREKLRGLLKNEPKFVASA